MYQPLVKVATGTYGVWHFASAYYCLFHDERDKMRTHFMHVVGAALSPVIYDQVTKTVGEVFRRDVGALVDRRLPTMAKVVFVAYSSYEVIVNSVEGELGAAGKHAVTLGIALALLELIRKVRGR